MNCATSPPDFFCNRWNSSNNLFSSGERSGSGHLAVRRKQPPEFAAAAERAARGFGQFVQNFGAVGRGVPEIFQRHDGVGQRVVAEALGFERARLDFVFRLPVLLADFVHHPFADGGVGAGDAGLAVVEIELALDFSRLKRGVFRVNAAGQFLRPFDGGLVRQPGGGGGLGAELAVQLLLARGKIPDGAFQRVQQREHFFDARITHNFCSAKAKRKLSGARVCL